LGNSDSSSHFLTDSTTDERESEYLEGRPPAASKTIAIARRATSVLTVTTVVDDPDFKLDSESPRSQVETSELPPAQGSSSRYVWNPSLIANNQK